MIVKTFKCFKYATEIICFLFLMAALCLLIYRLLMPVVIIQPMIEVCNAV